MKVSMSLTRLSLGPGVAVAVMGCDGVTVGLAIPGGVSWAGGAGAASVGVNVGWGIAVAGGWVGGGCVTGGCVGGGCVAGVVGDGASVAVGGGPTGVFVAGSAVGVGGTGEKVGVGGGEFCINPLTAGEKALANANVRSNVIIPNQKRRRRNRA